MILRFLASLKLAVVTMLGLVCVAAVGTVVESNQGAAAAQKHVYHSPLMTVLLVMLAINIFSVMVSRWPWKKRHVGFLLAHAGILVLLAGSFLTRLNGFEGIIKIKIGDVSREIVIPDSAVLTVYFSSNGKDFRPIFEHGLEDSKLKVAIPQSSFTIEEINESAIKINFNGLKQEIALDQLFKTQTPQGEYVISYARRRLDLGFDLKLDRFTVKTDPGTTRPASYESQVSATSIGERKISMNQPLDYSGLTIYQSEFESDLKGQPIYSILSVNYDPGRWVKYCGAIFVVAGIIAMFYLKRITA